MVPELDPNPSIMMYSGSPNPPKLEGKPDIFDTQTRPKPGKWCPNPTFATRTYHYFTSSYRPLPEELGVIEILTNIEAIHGGLVSDACKKTINILVKNSVEILENQIMIILEDLSGHMAPKISKSLWDEGQKLNVLSAVFKNLIFICSF